MAMKIIGKMNSFMKRNIKEDVLEIFGKDSLLVTSIFIYNNDKLLKIDLKMIILRFLIVQRRVRI